MKFLCIPCDSPMRLQSVGPPERGSLSVVYACPECGYEMAMLTNAYETQLVQSLGVRIGPDTAGGASSIGSAGAAEPSGRADAEGTRQTPDHRRTPAAEGRHPSDDESGSGALTSGSDCPFAAMIPAMEGALGRAGDDTPTGAGAATQHAPGGNAAPPGLPGELRPLRWTAAAEARLANIPAFVRPMARMGIETFARENGSREVDEKILDAARDFFGM